MWRVAVLTLALVGCASSSGVFEVGPGRYRVTNTAITSFGGSGAATGAGIKAANAHCAKQGKRAVIAEAVTGDQATQGSSDVTFTCE
jgi:hypothetical protein